MMTNWQKLILLGIMASSYIVGAHVWFKNGWSQADFAAMSQQVLVGVSTLFGISIYNSRTDQK